MPAYPEKIASERSYLNTVHKATAIFEGRAPADLVSCFVPRRRRSFVYGTESKGRKRPGGVDVLDIHPRRVQTYSSAAPVLPNIFVRRRRWFATCPMTHVDTITFIRCPVLSRHCAIKAGRRNGCRAGRKGLRRMPNGQNKRQVWPPSSYPPEVLE